jgi:ABC-type nitrate/sulfonate/bicarbonate transport system substrate-binding protein
MALATTKLRINEFVAPGLQALAQGLGYFETHGLELEVERTRSATEQRGRVMSNDCDAALTAIDNLLAWDAEGDDLRLVAQVEQTTVLDLVASPDIGSVAELRESTLAVDAVDSGFAIVLRWILAAHGIQPGEYRLQPEGGVKERLAALTARRADAGLLGPPWSGQALDAGLHGLTTVATALPQFPGIGLAVRASRLTELEVALKGYIASLERAADWAATAERDEAIRLLMMAGFDGPGATQVLDVCPVTLVPSREGLELVFTMRRELGMLPDRAPRPEVLLEWLPRFHRITSGTPVP